MERRRGPFTPPYTLNYRQIFILPTLFGGGFGLLLVLMTIGALNFNNNLALILTFVLVAASQLTMHLAYRNLAALRIMAVNAAPAFAGQRMTITLQIGETLGRRRELIETRVGEVRDCIDLPARQTATLKLSCPAPRRGWQRLPDIPLRTVYPLGLFRAWSWIRPRRHVLIYPAPARDYPPLPRHALGHGSRSRIGEGDEFHGIRGFRPGDPLNQIAWRSSARHGELMTRQMEQPYSEEIVLDWQRVPETDVEARLSVLCAWVLSAERQHLRYGLRLPGTELPVAEGPAHRDRCLRRLATYGLTPPQEGHATTEATRSEAQG